MERNRKVKRVNADVATCGHAAGRVLIRVICPITTHRCLLTNTITVTVFVVKATGMATNEIVFLIDANQLYELLEPASAKPGMKGVSTLGTAKNRA